MSADKYVMEQSKEVLDHLSHDDRKLLDARITLLAQREVGRIRRAPKVLSTIAGVGVAGIVLMVIVGSIRESVIDDLVKSRVEDERAVLAENYAERAEVLEIRYARKIEEQTEEIDSLKQAAETASAKHKAEVEGLTVYIDELKRRDERLRTQCLERVLCEAADAPDLFPDTSDKK